jgi:hypothetical protein
MGCGQLLPFRWVLDGIHCRKQFADHLRRLRRIDPKRAKECLAHASWVGVYPFKPSAHLRTAGTD